MVIVKCTGIYRCLSPDGWLTLALMKHILHIWPEYRWSKQMNSRILLGVQTCTSRKNIATKHKNMLGLRKYYWFKSLFAYLSMTWYLFTTAVPDSMENLFSTEFIVFKKKSVCDCEIKVCPWLRKKRKKNTLLIAMLAQC